MKKYSYYIFIGILIALGVTFLPMTFFSPGIVLGLSLLLGCYSILWRYNDPEDYHFLLEVFLLSFLLRVVVSSLLYNFVFIFNQTGLIDDGQWYSRNGDIILRMWLGGIKDIKFISEYMMSISWSGTIGSYDFWNAIVYFFTGKGPICLIFINCLASSLTVIFIYDIAKDLCNRKAASMAALLTAFWPSTFFWSLQNLKDSATVFAICFLMWIVFQAKKRFRFYFILLAIPLTFILKELRIFLVVVLYLFILPLSFFIESRFKKELLILSICLGTVLVFVFLDKIMGVYTKMFSDRSLLEWVHLLRTHRAYGGSAFLVEWDFTTVPKLIVFLPIALLASWLAPFPWQLATMRQIVSMPEMIAYYLFIPTMVYGIIFIIKNKVNKGALILVYVFTISLILAFIEGNIGTLFRHRSLFLPFVFILIGIGIYQRKVEAIREGNT